MNTVAPRLDLLPLPQRALWPELAAVVSRFVLYGGTAVALRCGHRASVDFDFFSAVPVVPDRLYAELPLCRGAQILQTETDTLTVTIDRGGPVKLSFFGGLSFGRVGEPETTVDGVARIASALDLAATKLATILRRVEPRDYWDVAVLLDHGVRLPVALGAARTLYGPVFSPIAAVKALTYFEGGDFSQVPPAVLTMLAAAAAQVERVEDVPLQSPSLS